MYYFIILIKPNLFITLLSTTLNHYKKVRISLIFITFDMLCFVVVILKHFSSFILHAKCKKLKIHQTKEF